MIRFLDGLRNALREGRVRDDLRQFVLFAVGYAFVLLLGYLVLRKINLTLSPAEMGQFSYMSSLVYVLMPIFYLGAPQAYLRFNDDHAVSRALHRALAPLFTLAVVGLAAVLWFKTKSWYALLFASYPLFNERLFVFRAQMRTSAVNTLKIAELLVPLAALYLLPLLGGGTWIATSNALLACYGVGYLLAVVFPLRLANAASCPTRGTLLKFLAPVMLTLTVAALVENLTVIATKALLGYEAAAQVGVATRNLIFIRALFSLLQMFYPVVYFREMKKGRFDNVRLYRLLVMGVAVLFVGALCLGAPLLYALTGAKAYVNSSLIFVLLSAAMFLDFTFDIYALYFQLEIRTWKATVIKILMLSLLMAGFSVLFLMGRDRVSPFAFAGVMAACAAVAYAAGIVWACAAERAYRRSNVEARA